MVDYITFLFYKFLSFLFSHLPKSIVKYLLDAIAYFVYIFGKKHRRIAKTNLDIAFGTAKSDKEKKKIILNSLKSMAYNLYEFVVLQNDSFESMKKKVSVENEEIILKLLKENRRVIIVTAHYGCWEFTLPYLALKYNPMTVISRKMNNPYLNKVFIKARENQGLSMCEKRGAIKCIIKALNSGRVVSLAIDQSISAKKGMEVTFFNHRATQTDSPIRLASKLDAVILPLFTLNEGFEQHKIVFHEPIEVPKELSHDDILRYSQMLSDLIEEQVKNRPGEWFWQHRRWKEYYRDQYE